jgi:hypothetical protein
MSQSHTVREARVIQLAQDGMSFMRQNYWEDALCVGSAWATLNLILVTLGLPKQLAPWETDVRTDETKTLEK